MKNILPIIIAVIVVGAGSFYGGMRYAKSTLSNNQGGFTNSATPGQFRGAQRGNRGAGFTVGQVIAKDEKSITVKLMNGGSTIVFASESTPVMKSVPGSLQDLTVGETVTVNGTPNQDGSVNAQSIQIRLAPPADRQPTPPAANQ